jgi:site-specific DNA recombinase
MIETGTRGQREFDLIVVHSFSRFFRDAFQLEFYLRRLQKHSVKVISITQESGDDPSSQLVRKVVALFDEYQSKENAKHTLRAMKENARQGFWNGSQPPYGYRAVTAEYRGDKAKKKLEIDPHEAEIVKMIFRLHLEGDGKGRLGLKAITDVLNHKNIRYRGGRRFSKCLVHRLLTRETYVGRHWFNQSDAKTGQPKPQEEWIAFEVPAIIDVATLEAARASLASRSPKVITPRIVNSPVLLTGLARCATCDGAMTLRTGKSGRYRYYTCSTCAQRGKTACKGRSVPMSFLDETVLKHLADRLFVPERMQQILGQHAEQSRHGTAEWKQKVKEADSELQDISGRVNRLYEMVERGVSPLDDSLASRLAQLGQRREEAIRLKATTQRRYRQVAQPVASLARIEEFCAEMRKRLLSADVATRKAYV